MFISFEFDGSFTAYYIFFFLFFKKYSYVLNLALLWAL